MGYRKTTRRLKVSLEGHKVYGAVDPGEEAPVAYARGKNLQEYLVLEGIADAPEEDSRSILTRQLEEFGDALISWNLEKEDGAPIPCSREGLYAIDNNLALALAKEWLDCLGGKVDESGPLPQSSPSGGPSLVESVPMEALSAPQEPSSVPA